MIGKLLGPLGFALPAYDAGQMRKDKPNTPRQYTSPRGLAEIHRKALDEADAARGPEPDYMNSWGAAGKKAGDGLSLLAQAMRDSNAAQAAKAIPFEGPMPPSGSPAPQAPQASPGIPPQLAGMMMGAGPFGLAGGAPSMPQTSSAPWWLEQAQKLGGNAPAPQAAPSPPPTTEMLPMPRPRPQEAPGWMETAMFSHGLEGNVPMKDFYREDLTKGIGGLLKRALG